MGMKPVKSTQGKHRTSIIFLKKKKKKKKLKAERYSHFGRQFGGLSHNIQPNILLPFNPAIARFLFTQR